MVLYKGANYTFFHARGGPARRGVAQSRVRNLCQLNALAECDLVVTATSWQKKQYPQQIAKHIHVIHEGVDTDFFPRSPSASVSRDVIFPPSRNW